MTCIDHLDTCLEDCPRCIQLDIRWWHPVYGSPKVGLHGTFAINGLAQDIEDAA